MSISKFQFSVITFEKVTWWVFLVKTIGILQKSRKLLKIILTYNFIEMYIDIFRFWLKSFISVKKIDTFTNELSLSNTKYLLCILFRKDRCLFSFIVLSDHFLTPSGLKPLQIIIIGSFPFLHRVSVRVIVASVAATWFRILRRARLLHFWYFINETYFLITLLIWGHKYLFLWIHFRLRIFQNIIQIGKLLIFHIKWFHFHYSFC